MTDRYVSNPPPLKIDTNYVMQLDILIVTLAKLNFWLFEQLLMIANMSQIFLNLVPVYDINVFLFSFYSVSNTFSISRQLISILSIFFWKKFRKFLFSVALLSIAMKKKICDVNPVEIIKCIIVSFWETLKIECVLPRKFQISFWTKSVSFSWKFYHLYLYLPIVVFEINPPTKVRSF